MSSSWKKEEKSHCQKGYTKLGEALLKGKAQYGDFMLDSLPDFMLDSLLQSTMHEV